jgi:hypothetical protein
MLDDLDTKCPECGGTVRFSLEDVARQRTVRCSGGCSVELRDEGGGARDTQRALADLDRSLKGLSRTIKFKL